VYGKICHVAIPGPQFSADYLYQQVFEIMLKFSEFSGMCRIGLFLLWLCCPLLVEAAHPISVTETSVFVTGTRAIVRIQFFAEDLMLFHGLQPVPGPDGSGSNVISAEDLRRGLELHKTFLLDKVSLRDAAGEPYTGTVTSIKSFEIPEAGLPETDLMLHAATYELEYIFPQPPEFLTIQQDITDANFLFPSEMKLSVHQTGTDLTYTDSLRAGASVSLRFDWTVAPLTQDATDEDWEKWFEKQREATLGITSYSSIYSFVYIEPAEVRHEVLIPLASLNAFLSLQHRDPAFVELDEQDAVRQLIRDWLTGGNPAKINGLPVTPEFTRIDFYGLDLKDFAAQAAARRVSLASGRVGIIMTYRPQTDSVTEVSLTWDRFNSQVKKIESVVFSWPDSIERFEFSRYAEPEKNVLKWSCPPERLPVPVTEMAVQTPEKPVLRIPVVSVIAALCSLLCLGLLPRSGRSRILSSGMLFVVAVATLPFARVTLPHPWKSPPELTDAEARKIFEHLHRGIYRAPDFGTETRIYDVLKKSVSGNLLNDIYLQLRQSLEMREQGGAVARVRSVEHDQWQQLPRSSEQPAWPGFQVRSSWVVAGTVEHWGHVHERQNRFAAVFTVEPESGFWKITAMNIEDQQQMSQKTSLRKF
jgi:hypothetical protein